MRKLGANREATFAEFREFAETRDGAVVANIAICLIHQASYLLDQQIRRLEKDFVEKGGIRERMTEARLRHRRKKREE